MSAQTWLTQEAADRLRAELENLEQHGRKDVTAKIEAARAEGDLKENGGYHAARDEQGKMEARIRPSCSRWQSGSRHGCYSRDCWR